jgi:drug/metabolite transporter (DMT)-like permease
MTAPFPLRQDQRPLFGVGFMLAAMAALPFIDVIAKMLGQEQIPILQVVWARLVFGTVVTLPFALLKTGPSGLLPRRPVFHILRAGLLVLATFTFFSALKYLPIADALAIFFVQPLIVTILSALVLKEHVGPRRWTAVAVGFIGTLIIIRPGFVEWNPGSLLALGGGTFLAIYFVMTRQISGQAHAIVTTFQTNLAGAAMLCLVAPLVWVWPSPSQWALFAMLGMVATFGHFLVTRAYDFAEASLLAPLAYTEMIMATILGWYFFGDFPDSWTFVGVGVLISCALYISIRERKVKATPITVLGDRG